MYQQHMLLELRKHTLKYISFIFTWQLGYINYDIMNYAFAKLVVAW